MTVRVFRRFEVQGLDPVSFTAVTRILIDAEQQESISLLTRPSVEPSPSLQVRLEGTAPAISYVIDQIKKEGGGRIYRDFVDVAPGTPRERPYPDPQSLLRMGGDPDLPVPLAASNTGINAPKSPVTIAIVDSGIMVDHPDLRPNLWEEAPGINGARCINGKVDHELTDEDGHGTMLAGTILATAGSDSSIKLMAVKFFDGATRPSAANAAAAIRFAVHHGAHIIHLSWELGIPSDDVRRAIAEAYTAGRLVVFAAGNEGANADDMKATPSQYASDCREQAIVVMATDWYDNKAWFSSYGEESVDIAAPGVNIMTTCPFVSTASMTGDHLLGRYRVYSGTSAASAHVTGAAALVKSRYPGLGAADLKAALFQSADHPPDLKRRCRSEGRLKIA
jgi:subtilisin family serine protease